MLREHLDGATTGTQMFDMPPKERVARMLRADMEAAGILWEDEEGHVADFHALRHTHGSWLAAAGIPVKTIQTMMRHSSITLSMDTYAHSTREDEVAAVAQLPDLAPGTRAV